MRMRFLAGLAGILVAAAGAAAQQQGREAITSADITGSYSAQYDLYGLLATGTFVGLPDTDYTFEMWAEAVVSGGEFGANAVKVDSRVRRSDAGGEGAWLLQGDSSGVLNNGMKVPPTPGRWNVDVRMYRAGRLVSRTGFQEVACEFGP